MDGSKNNAKHPTTKEKTQKGPKNTTNSIKEMSSLCQKAKKDAQRMARQRNVQSCNHSQMKTDPIIAIGHYHIQITRYTSHS